MTPLLPASHIKIWDINYFKRYYHGSDQVLPAKISSHGERVKGLTSPLMLVDGKHIMVAT